MLICTSKFHIVMADVGNPDQNQSTWTYFCGSCPHAVCLTALTDVSKTHHTHHNHIRANQSRLCQTISIIQELLQNTNSSQSHRTRVIFYLEKKIKLQQTCYEFPSEEHALKIPVCSSSLASYACFMYLKK